MRSDNAIRNIIHFYFELIISRVPDEFVFPLKHCNLADAIKAVRLSDPPPLKVWTWQDFCRILFQTAKGLRYLHTPIPNVR